MRASWAAFDISEMRRIEMADLLGEALATDFLDLTAEFADEEQ